MKKQLLALFSITFLTAASYAQNAVHKITFGPELAIPAGTLSSLSSVGFGGTIQGEFNVANQLNLTASAGYVTFPYKKIFSDFFESTGLEMKNVSSIPVKAGAKLYLGKYFYGAAELGAAFNTGEGNGALFVYSPTVGLSFPVSSQSNLDLGVRYETWSNDGSASFFGLKAAFGFGL